MAGTIIKKYLQTFDIFNSSINLLLFCLIHNITKDIKLLNTLVAAKNKNKYTS